MEDRGCRGRTARKHWPVLPAISILPSGSLATSFAKPIPRWDEMGRRRRCCSVFNQRWEKKKKDWGYHDIHLKEDVNSFLSHFFVCAGFVKVRNNGTTRKTKSMSYNRGRWRHHIVWVQNDRAATCVPFLFLKGKVLIEKWSFSRFVCAAHFHIRPNQCWGKWQIDARKSGDN